MLLAPATPEAYKLMHDGAQSLSIMEANGFRVDMDYIDRISKEMTEEVRKLTGELRSDPIYATWQKHFGSKTKLGNREQLGHIIFEVMGNERKEVFGGEDEDSSEGKNSKAAFDNVKLPFIDKYFEMMELHKARVTWLGGIKRESIEVSPGFWKVHGSFNLHIPVSYRGSMDMPNLQNVPIRNPRTGELIRSAFIPEDGYQIVENDFKAIEVCVGYCYHKDPVMKKYLLDPKTDMHRDMAAQIYHLEHMPKEYWKEGGKNVRYCGKNQFVFPQFYGDYYLHCAKHLWESIKLMNLQVEGVSLYDHLASLGGGEIDQLGACDPREEPIPGTFEYHVRQVEKDFWGRRFKVYDQWKKDWYKTYLKTGGFRMLTGFVCEGIYKKNKAVNYPVQGSAFHCLLWVLNQLTDRLRKYKMKSKLVLQIHDSMIGMVWQKELQNYLEIVKELVEVELAKHWPWIIIPMKVEAEVCAPGTSWHGKKEVKI